MDERLSECVCVPVFPEVGSMIVSPPFSTPSLSASSTILTPILSLTEPPALKNSHLATEDMRQEEAARQRQGERKDEDISTGVMSAVK